VTGKEEILIILDPLITPQKIILNLLEFMHNRDSIM
jgi:hypothetical protein